MNSELKRPLKSWEVIGGILFGIFVVWWLASSSNSADSKTSNTNLTAENVNTFQFTTTAKELATLYEENTVAADNKFKGKRFEIAGTIAAINTDFMDSAIIVLKGGVNEFMEPQAELVDAEKQKAASLKKGQKIALICTGAGDIAKSPMMKDCVIK